VDTALAQLIGRLNIAELWNAMTRPINRNGLGLAVAEAEREVRAIEAGMSLLPERGSLPRVAQDRRAVQCLGSSCT
jgi:hypothetical protein